jgi:PAS domain S-box-containing protein
MIDTDRHATTSHGSQEPEAQHETALTKEVEERTRRLEAVLDTAVSAIITIDAEGRMRTANSATTRMFGYPLDELIGQNVSKLMPEPDAHRHDGYIKAYLTTGQRKIIGIGREVVARRKDGSTFPIHLAVSEFEVAGATLFSGIVTDLSQRAAAEAALRESERQLAQAQKLDAVGQLTEGIAHDFNNILTVITGNLELIDMLLDDERCRDLLRRAEEAARMGARLTGRLSSFSRRRASQAVEIDLNEMVMGMTELIRRSLGESISVTSELMPRLWSVNADPSEVENVILNLAINARDAMPNGGRIGIKTSNVTLSASDLAGSPHVAPGEHVMISVADNGSGMPPEVLARAFEPFFTTKEPGRGTGLGLATIYGFVRRSHGHVAIDSVVSRGTIVRIYLPRTTAEPNVAAVGPSPELPAIVPGAAVLVVEDNDEVRALAARRLALLGYETLTVENGARAIELLEEGHKVDVVFSDVVMPGGVSGFDLARWLANYCPHVPILLTSGFAPYSNQHEDQLGQQFRVLAKPYTQAELARAMREVLFAART